MATLRVYHICVKNATLLDKMTTQFTFILFHFRILDVTQESGTCFDVPRFMEDSLGFGFVISSSMHVNIIM